MPSGVLGFGWQCYKTQCSQSTSNQSIEFCRGSQTLAPICWSVGSIAVAFLIQKCCYAHCPIMIFLITKENVFLSVGLNFQHFSLNTGFKITFLNCCSKKGVSWNGLASATLSVNRITNGSQIALAKWVKY